jgi:aminoglycoside phosphotransferase
MVEVGRGADVPHAMTAAQAGCASVGISVTDIEPLSGGYVGGNFLASTSVGRLVLKFRPHPRPLFVARTASHLISGRGLPHSTVVAGPIPTDAGWLVATQWLAGVSMAEADVSGWDQTTAERFGYDFGCWLRTLHTIRLRRGAWLPRAKARFDAKMVDCLSRGLIDDALAGQLRQFWADAEPALAGAPLTLIHRDLQPGNVIVEDGYFRGVIDLEQARVADPLYDLVKPADQLFPLHPAVVPAFWRAYGSNKPDFTVRLRLAVVFALEYLSALVYFDKHGDQVRLADRIRRLRQLVDGEIPLAAVWHTGTED